MHETYAMILSIAACLASRGEEMDYTLLIDTLRNLEMVSPTTGKLYNTPRGMGQGISAAWRQADPSDRGLIEMSYVDKNGKHPWMR